MVKTIISMMVASVAADQNPDKLLLESVGNTDSGVHANDRQLSYWIERDWDKSLDKQMLLDDLDREPKEKRLCSKFNPKKLGKFDIRIERDDSPEDIWRKCIDRNWTALSGYYYEARNNNQTPPKIQLWMRESSISNVYYCEDLEKKPQEAVETCMFKKKWAVQELDLEAIHMKTPIKFECDHKAERNFLSWNNQKCSEIDFDRFDYCGQGVPSDSKWAWEEIGTKNNSGQSVVNTCCECSERRDPQADALRARIEEFAEAKKVCYKSVDFGNGKNSKEMWYFDNEDYVCKEFTFTGSLKESNTTKNRFFSERKCNDLCG